jgi:hypothetical protein
VLRELQHQFHLKEILAVMDHLDLVVEVAEVLAQQVEIVGPHLMWLVQEVLEQHLLFLEHL